MQDVLNELYRRIIKRGSEVDNPSEDSLYLKIERALILELTILDIDIFSEKEEDLISELFDEYISLLAELEID